MVPLVPKFGLIHGKPKPMCYTLHSTLCRSPLPSRSYHPPSRLVILATPKTINYRTDPDLAAQGRPNQLLSPKQVRPTCRIRISAASSPGSYSKSGGINGKSQFFFKASPFQSIGNSTIPSTSGLTCKKSTSPPFSIQEHTFSTSSCIPGYPCLFHSPPTKYQ